MFGVDGRSPYTVRQEAGKAKGCVYRNLPTLRDVRSNRPPPP